MKGTRVVVAFLDAAVLYPAFLRDLFMRLAVFGVFRANWSARVQDEWTIALLRNRPDLARTLVERTRQLMDAHFPEALVVGYEHRIELITLPDADDRHVAAARFIAARPRSSPRICAIFRLRRSLLTMSPPFTLTPLFSVFSRTIGSRPSLRCARSATHSRIRENPPQIFWTPCVGIDFWKPLTLSSRSSICCS